MKTAPVTGSNMKSAVGGLANIATSQSWSHWAKTDYVAGASLTG